MFGVLGALVLRNHDFGGWLDAAAISLAAYVFGGFLLFTGVKMWFSAGTEMSLTENPALKLLRRVMTVSKHYDGEKFFTLENGRRVATPLLMVVVVIEFSDVVFAVFGSAIYAVTAMYIVLTSNIFAILGCTRASLFLLLAVIAIASGDYVCLHSGVHRPQDAAD